VKVDVQRALYLVVRRPGEVVARDDAGVVYDDVEPAERVDDLVDAGV